MTHREKYYCQQLQAFSLSLSGWPFRVIPVNLAEKILCQAIGNSGMTKMRGSLADNIAYMRTLKN